MSHPNTAGDRESEPIWYVTTAFFKDGGRPVMYGTTTLGPAPKDVAFLLRRVVEDETRREGAYFIDSRTSGVTFDGK
jgi:hypothetical protein